MDAMIAALGAELAVPLPEAQAIFRALAAPGLYRELVEQLGWTPDRLAGWMSETLQQHLLRADWPINRSEQPCSSQPR